MIRSILSVFSPTRVEADAHSSQGGPNGWLIALLPLAIAVYLATLLEPIAAGEVFSVVLPWVPSLGITLSFYVDGLSLLFALLVSGIGTLVMIYAGSYLAGHPQLGRLYGFLTLFMVAMLGLVLADNIMTMFIFWELTSISSYLLIGFKHEKREVAEVSALQALLVTGERRPGAAGRAILLAPGGWQLGADRPAAGRRPVYAPAIRSTCRSLLLILPVPSPSQPSSPSISGCPTPWPRRRRSAPICTRRRWSKRASICWRG